MLTDADSDLMFFLNGAFLSIIVGAVFVADASLPWWAYVAPFVIAYILYLLAVTRLALVAEARGAGIDLHRLELYDKLGFCPPASPDEELEVAKALNRLVIYAVPIPAELFKKPSATSTEDEAAPVSVQTP